MDRPVEDFGPNKHKRSGLDDFCRPCRRNYNAEYYARTKDRHNPNRLARRKRHQQICRDAVIRYLKNHPCVDCGTTELAVLEFDHCRGAKQFNISDAVRQGRALKIIYAEIIKCDVVCANDHRRRTAVRQGWIKAIN